MVCNFLAAPHRQDGLPQPAAVTAHLGEQLFAMALVIGQGQEQVLDGDVGVVEFLFEGVGAIEHRIEALAQIDVVGWGRKTGLGSDGGIEPLAEAAHIHACLFENAAGQTLLGQERSEQMLAFHLLLALLLGQLLGTHHGAPGIFCE